VSEQASLPRVAFGDLTFFVKGTLVGGFIGVKGATVKRLESLSPWATFAILTHGQKNSKADANISVVGDLKGVYDILAVMKDL
jgi:hypothetical protein